MRISLLLSLIFLSACGAKQPNLPEKTIRKHVRILEPALDETDLGAWAAFLYENKPKSLLCEVTTWFDVFSWCAEDLEQAKAYDELIADPRVKSKLMNLRKYAGSIR
jgi:hypothetical protein